MGGDARNRRHIYVIGHVAKEWSSANSHCWRIEAHSTAKAAMAAMAIREPSLIAVDLGGGICSDFGDIPPRLNDSVPHVALSAHEGFDLRMALARKGYASLLRPADGPQALIDLAERVANPALDEPFRVLVLASSPTLRKAAGTCLAMAGITPKLIARPAELLEWLTKMSPDVLVIEATVDGIFAQDLVAMLRQEERNSGLSVMIVDGGRLPYQQDLPPPNVEIYTGAIEISRFVEAIRGRAAYSRQLARLLYSDGLTGLLAPRGIRSRLEAEIARAKREDTPLAFALMDLDRFKQVNDTHGHLAGDAVIRAFASVLSQRLRAMDIGGRYGGEEFAVIFPNTAVAAAAAVLDEVRAEFASLGHSGESGPFHVTVSAGIAGLCSGDRPENLIGTADAALYRAKESGRNRIVT